MKFAETFHYRQVLTPGMLDKNPKLWFSFHCFCAGSCRQFFMWRAVRSVWKIASSTRRRAYTVAEVLNQVLQSEEDSKNDITKEGPLYNAV